MTEEQEHPSRASFEERLARAREAERRHRGPAGKPEGGLGVGMRLSLELVSGVVVGALIGWGLDGWFGTSPWLLLVFTLLGLGAGFRNLMRVTAELGRRAEEAEDEDGRTSRPEHKAPDGGK